MFNMNNFQQGQNNQQMNNMMMQNMIGNNNLLLDAVNKLENLIQLTNDNILIPRIKDIIIIMKKNN